MDRCPKCGAEDNTQAQRYTPTRLDGPKAIHGRSFVCGSTAWSDGRFSESTKCLRRQLAAANERVGRLEKALRDAIEHVAGSRIGHYGDHTAHCDITVRPERLTAWVKALEVPDAM